MEASYPVTASGLLVASPTDVQWQNCSQAAALNCSGGGDGGVPGGGPDGDDAVADDLTYRVTVAILLSIIILCTIVGNVFVVLAVVREKILHKTLANRLIGSLAVTDLLVAVLVMPLTAVTLITVVWPFGQVMCDFFVFIDVLFCTASILHLVAIAVDRYWTVTDVEYAQKVGKRQSLVFYAMVALAWGVAACVCIPPLFEWRNEYSEGVCRISQDIGYTVYSTLLAFYAPLLVIIAIYGKIFFLVRQRVRERLLSRRQLSEVNGGGADDEAAPAAAARAADDDGVPLRRRPAVRQLRSHRQRPDRGGEGVRRRAATEEEAVLRRRRLVAKAHDLATHQSRRRWRRRRRRPPQGVGRQRRLCRRSGASLGEGGRQARAASASHAPHHHGHIRRLLAAVLRVRRADAVLPQLPSAQNRARLGQLARLLQQRP